MGDREGNGYGGGPDVLRWGGGWDFQQIPTGNGQGRYSWGYQGDGRGSGLHRDSLRWAADGAGSQDRE